MHHNEIVWVNGTFDVLHMGHINLFQKAHEIASKSKYYDWKVIVGVDTDERIKKAKGDTRPVNNLWNRIDFLTSIKYVDRVHHFGTDDELRTIIKGLQPRWMVIGNDYIGKEIIGREYIKEIIFVPRYQGLSSTKIINGAHN